MREQSGISLVELMVSITVGLVLLAGVTQLFLSSNLTFSTQNAMSRVQETGRLAIEFLSEDIRMAGYVGCANPSRHSGSGDMKNFLNDSDLISYRYDVAVEGEDSSKDVAGFPNAALAGTDAILIRSAFGSGVGVADMSNPTQIFVENTGVESGECDEGKDKYSGFCEGDIVVVSSCSYVRVFQATGFVGASTSETIGIQHSDIASFEPGNKVAVWGAETTDGHNSFGKDAQVINLESTFYYIANGTSGRPSLFREVNGEQQELLEGVEDMQITYGLDINDDDVIDAYQTAEKIGSILDWKKVSTVRLDLLVASIEDSVLQEAQPYTFDGKVINNPGDRRLRQVFTSVVTIRSRVP
ncbi:PilW family protein [Microbulbifer variabilis]|uniref:PilW family protein n=1 Tax=Microbulbifer variabilis TaxID=266805 RepID=A0ABY4VD83_9GAMM|nr:PilW family protein [Microbulbifer variabilis]USD22092.1 PilW family protein [Microbulbifer variabilis]